MLKRIYLLAVMALLLPTLAACGQGATTEEAPAATSAPAAEATSAPAAEATAAPATDAATAPAAGAATAPAGGADNVDRSRLSEELFLYNWSDYIDPSLLTDFENEYGVRVTLETFDSNENMLARIRAGNSGYDIVMPSDYAVDIMIKEGLAAELDKSVLTNIGNMNPDYLNQPFDPENRFSIPYFVGTTGIAYNQKYFPTPPDSWAALFDPAQLEQVRGRVSMLDDERESIGAALMFSGFAINDSSPAALARAEELLIAQKPFLASYNSSDFSRRLASEEVIIAHTWNGGTAMAFAGLGDEFEGNPDIRFIIPKEGGTLWMDNFVIVADSPNKYTAEVFINFMMRPEIAARNADYVYYTTPNKAAEALVSDELKEIYELGFGIREEDVPRLQRIQRSDESSVLFSDVWTRVKAS